VTAGLRATKTAARLKPSLAHSFRLHSLPVRLNRALQRPPANLEASLQQKVLAHHVDTTAMADKALAQPILVPIQQLTPLRRLEARRPAHQNTVPDRAMAVAHSPANPLASPAIRLQAQYLRHIARRLHLLLPWIAPHRASEDLFPVHSNSPLLVEEGQFLMAQRGPRCTE
jgi:hypothetical protein